MQLEKCYIDKNYNVLSIDGGGIRGLIALNQLVHLEKSLNKPIYEVFDLFSGTSTGSIIAVLLALGYTATEILDFYLSHSNDIFKRKWYRFGIFRPRYSDKAFNKILKKYVKDLTLKDLKKDVIITSYNATLGVKKIFKSRKAKVDNTYNYYLFDVVRASASAQTFFKPHRIKDYFYIDGGMVINNPAMISYTEVLNYDVEYKNINILSYSTGTVQSIINKKILRGGKLIWAKSTVDILLKEQALITDYHMSTIGLNNNNLNYIRLESYLEKSNGKIDDVTENNIKNMIMDSNLSILKNQILLEKFIQLL